MNYDVIIAGAGLAGACAALVLSRDRHVAVLDAGQAASGASGVAAGLVNPFMGRGSRPAWRHAEALDALSALLQEAYADALFAPNGMLRPVRSPDRLASARRAAAEHPAELRFLRSDALREQAPGLVAPHGALHIMTGGSVSIPDMVRAFLRVARERGASVVEDCPVRSWRSAGDRVEVLTAAGHMTASMLILSAGRHVLQFPGCSDLPLHPIKGQTIAIPRPSGYALPPVSGASYIVPTDDRLLVGASFEHAFDDLRPSAAMTEQLLREAVALVPDLEGSRVLDARAGVRLTIPASYAPHRLPLVAELPGQRGVFVFAGLGAKGLMTAPLIAEALPDVLENPAALHKDLARLRPA